MDGSLSQRVKKGGKGLQRYAVGVKDVTVCTRGRMQIKQYWIRGNYSRDIFWSSYVRWSTKNYRNFQFMNQMKVWKNNYFLWFWKQIEKDLFDPLSASLQIGCKRMKCNNCSFVKYCTCSLSSIFPLRDCGGLLGIKITEELASNHMQWAFKLQP